jgi:hypothetical protein
MEIKLGGACNNDINNAAYSSTSIIYVDATQGWLALQSSASSIGAPTYIVATGGTITTCGDYKIHTFTADGCFAVTTAPTPANNNVDYLVVAVEVEDLKVVEVVEEQVVIENLIQSCFRCLHASPLATATYLPVSTQTYPVTVGAGGAGWCLQILVQIQYFQQSHPAGGGGGAAQGDSRKSWWFR